MEPLQKASDLSHRALRGTTQKKKSETGGKYRGNNGSLKDKKLLFSFFFLFFSPTLASPYPMLVLVTANLVFLRRAADRHVLPP